MMTFDGQDFSRVLTDRGYRLVAQVRKYGSAGTEVRPYSPRFISCSNCDSRHRPGMAERQERCTVE